MGSVDANPLDAHEVTVKSMTDKTQETFCFPRKTMEKKQEMFTNNLVKLKNKRTETNNTLLLLLLLSRFSHVRLCATP